MKRILTGACLVGLCCLAVGSVNGQTAAVYVGDVSGEFSPTKLEAGQPVVIRVDFDGTGLTGLQPPGGPPFTHGNWIYTHGFLIHGDADWGGVTSRRLADAQRQFVEAGPMTFTTGIVNSLWLKAGGSGDPNFGSPGSAITEAFGQVFSGPTGGNSTGSDTVGVFIGLTATGASDGWNPETQPVSQRYQFEFTTQLADHGKFICLDTITQPLGAWEWSSGLETQIPTWDNGLGDGNSRCWEVFDPNAPNPSNLVLSEDTLYFSATLGDPNPPAQTFDVTSDNDPLAFTLTEAAPWLLKNPSSGTTPTNVSVSVTLVGLTPDVYFDSIQVASTGADNSPQFLFVQLDLAEPPPTIGVSSTSFVFNAVVGGSNPAPQILTINNTGQSTLNWTVSNSESWLQLAPGSGVNTGNVTLSVDITGLGFGDYFDVITVSDPAATNDPVDVDVQLSIASDLPLIEVDTTHLYYVVPLLNGSMVTRSFEVRNGGGGTLNFTASSNSVDITSIVPSSATAPQMLDVNFDFHVSGSNVITNDTVVITSPSAVNSPLKVIITQKQVFSPAEIVLSDDTVHLNVFECSQGFGQDLPTTTFTVSNGGGDNPMEVETFYESDYFSLLPSEAAPAPLEFTLSAHDLGLPLGTYYDTITVSSVWAINKPQMVIVEYNVIAGIDQPEMVIQPSTTITVPWQEESGPVVVPGIEIYNAHGGCMPWNTIETDAWFDLETPSGDVPGSTDLFLNPDGFTLGEVNSGFLVQAPSASNSPIFINLNLQVWRYRGDMNWNGKLTIQDAVLLVDYLLNGGAPPQPTLVVGDTNCDDINSISDIARLIDYLFFSLSPICNNP